MTSHLLPTYARVDLAFERGEGVWLYATNGDRYLDFTGGVAVNALGHAHPYLIEALTEHRIAGAAVDVFDTEPLPPQHPYRRIDNLLATPHIGFVSRGLYERFYRDTVTNIVAWLDGVG